MSHTVRFHRVIKAPAERVYRALLDPHAMVKWSPPHGFTGTMLAHNPTVGGHYRMAFNNLTTGQSHSFGGTYLALIPNEEIHYNDVFDDPNLPGTMETRITLKKVSCGTEITIEQSGIPEVIPPEMCYLGWQESLHLFTLLVEPEIRE